MSQQISIFCLIWHFHLTDMLHKVCVCEWFNIVNEVKTFLSFENLLLSLISWVRTLAHGLYAIHWTQSGWLQGHCVPPKTALIPNVPMVFSCCSFRPLSSCPLLNVGICMYAQPYRERVRAKLRTLYFAGSCCWAK